MSPGKDGPDLRMIQSTVAPLSYPHVWSVIENMWWMGQATGVAKEKEENLQVAVVILYATLDIAHTFANHWMHQNPHIRHLYCTAFDKWSSTKSICLLVELNIRSGAFFKER